MRQEKAQRRRIPWTAIRAAVGVSLAFLLVKITLNSTETDLGEVLSGASKPLLLSVLLVYGIILGVTVARWGLLLRVQGIRLRFRELAQLTMIGVFFNMAVPGAVGGDLLKMAYVVKRVPGKGAETVLTIMLDRVLGVMGLFIVASVMVLLSMGFLLGLDPAYRPLQVGAFVVGLGSLGGILALVLVELRESLLRLPFAAAVLEFVTGKLPAAVVGIAERLIKALDLYRRHRRTVVAAVLLSVLVHSLLAVELFCIARAVGESRLRMRDCFLAAQVANAVAAVPLTPAGVGTRDFVIWKFFEAMEAERSAAAGIPVTFSLVMLFWSLVGAAVFIAFRPAAGRAPPPAGTPAGTAAADE